MRVAIANLTNGGLSGGYRKYLAELLPCLASHSVVESMMVFIPEGAHLPTMEGLHLVSMAGDSHRRGFADVAEKVVRSRPDVVFVPTARWRPFDSVPVVCMIRNMEPLEVPFAGNGPIESLKNLGRVGAAKKAATRATRVIAVSQTVRNHVVSRWDLDPARVGVVQHGVKTDVQSQRELSAPSSLRPLERKRFFFTAGSIRPARGLEDAIGALGLLKAQGVCHQLAIGGHVEWSTRFGRHLKELMREQAVGEQVYWLGQLTSQEMDWCFDNCSAFLMTSRAEACPNTLLEAMAHGCLCVATKIDVMVEFLGPKALLYDPGDRKMLAWIIEKVGDVPSLHYEVYRNEAKSRAQEFTWERTAKRTVVELAKAAGIA